jgi:hypothetical protein
MSFSEVQGHGWCGPLDLRALLTALLAETHYFKMRQSSPTPAGANADAGGEAELLTSQLGRVRLLTLNRPRTLNAFSERLYDATARALIDAGNDPSVAVLVLTGTGRAYTSGVDVKELEGRRTGETVRGEFSFNGFIREVAFFPKPLICAVNGLAVGVGATMSIANARQMLSSVRAGSAESSLAPSTDSYVSPWPTAAAAGCSASSPTWARRGLRSGVDDVPSCVLRARRAQLRVEGPLAAVRRRG